MRFLLSLETPPGRFADLAVIGDLRLALNMEQISRMLSVSVNGLQDILEVKRQEIFYNFHIIQIPSFQDL